MMRRIMLLCGMIAVTVSGCTYVNNKSWDDMTPEEQEEVRQVFEEERKELEEDENMSDNGFAQYILDKWRKRLIRSPFRIREPMISNPPVIPSHSFGEKSESCIENKK